MYLNSYSVRVPEGVEVPGGYVELLHGTQYTLVINNDRNVRCDARIEVDGKHVGTWRLEAGQNARLERPAHDTGRFTFYKIGTDEARKVGLSEGDPNLGLVKVTFTPESGPRPIKPVNWGWQWASKGDTPKWRLPGNDLRTRYPSAGGANTYAPEYNLTSSLGESRSAGGTGLSGNSGQIYGQAYEIVYDYTQQTVIHLRLVAKSETNEPRPLTSYSTPVPPAIR